VFLIGLEYLLPLDISPVATPLLVPEKIDLEVNVSPFFKDVAQFGKLVIELLLERALKVISLLVLYLVLNYLQYIALKGDH
jgi:hypothetical protein